MNTETQKTMFSSASDEWSTPQWLFDRVNDVFNFDFDAAATAKNTKTKKWMGLDRYDALKRGWPGYLKFWLNPPYSRGLQSKFIERAYWYTKFSSNTNLVVALIPARTDTKLFHEYCFKANYILFLQGRLKFGDSKNSAPFPSCLVFFGDVKEKDVMKLSDLGRIIKL